MESNAATVSLATEIVGAIRDASFPESEEVLSSSINENNISPLLSAIEVARNDLSETVRKVSRQEAGDVDGWIEQAKRVQADIARCKEEARHIIQEHEHIETLRSTQDQARSKSSLLQAEINFNETLEKQILLISETSAALSKVETDIRQQQLLVAAKSLPSIAGTIDKIPGHQSRALLERIHSDLEQRLSKELQRDLDDHVLISSIQNEVSLHILQVSPSAHSSLQTDDSHVTTRELSLDEILDAMNLLGSRDQAIIQISQRIDATLLPHLYKRSKLKIAGTLQREDVMLVALSVDVPTAALMTSAGFAIAKYLHNLYPTSARKDLVMRTLSWVVPLLVTEWLNPAIPTDLDHLTSLGELQDLVQSFDAWLKGNDYEEIKELELWVKEVSKTWLSKRRSLALDAVRNAFKRANGATRQVERVERQTASARKPQPESVEDDWADNWEDDDDETPATGDRKAEQKSDGEDGSDAWGFDAEDQADDRSLPSSIAVSGDASQEDEAEAWGWGDEDDPNAKVAPPRISSSIEPNGLQSSKDEHKDVMLKESYSITDIPDYILEQIGIDLTDDYRVHESPSTYFQTVKPLPDLGSLPTLTLAMFRAIAASCYQSEFSPPLSSMHLYNDVLYLASRLADNFSEHSTISASTRSVLPSQTPMLEKFARQVYTSEISTHRTILLDLLDTAQGFVSCTRSPYAETCETAIVSTTEHLRSIHAQWSPILSSSHLYQSTGNLLNSIMRKIIEDIEDMEDISEAESKKLVSLCEPIGALQDLFMVEKPRDRGTATDSQEEGLVSMIAVHCASYLRFQYLQEILVSNLVEIKFLWTDAGLSLEFRPEEVVDLIEALFTESPQRRSAINTIKTHG